MPFLILSVVFPMARLLAVLVPSVWHTALRQAWALCRTSQRV
jgi:hypothetical protein